MQISAGEILEGKVTGITNFGVFVDLGEGKSGMVHISEIAQSFVNDIKEHVKENDIVKVKVINISEDGKITLSIKRALEKQKPVHLREKGQGKQHFVPSQVSHKTEPTSFEEMLSKFKQTSEEKFSDLKKKNPDARRVKRGFSSK